MLNIFGKKNSRIQNPIKGTIIPVEEIPDEVFARKMMGDGFGIIPEDSMVYSPVDGTIIKVFKTKHVLLIKSVQGLDLIVHLGLETVELKGEGFEIFVKNKQVVKAGDLLAKVDFDFIVSKNKSPISAIIITNIELVKSMDISYGPQVEKSIVCICKP